ncbi:12256_t:CDS:10 [Funneliformis geosporum]|uniref:12256_t:CDS:1 n=1 Tax=Funneliformis geosporum TaxID=1117311 RepID=A0A9W4SB24_9GLOM|nr:12256_t:CDS:10 [Funneliformis geosporum]
MSFRRTLSLFNPFTTIRYESRPALCHTLSFAYSKKHFINFRSYSSTTNLPNKVKLLLSEIESTIATGGVSKGIKQVVGSTYGGNYRLKWTETPRSVLVVKKPFTESTSEAFVEILSWLRESHPDINIIVEPEVIKEFGKELSYVNVIPQGQQDEYARTVDFVITLGGDGTILHVSSIFNKCVPPVISFSMGTFGFLLPFRILNKFIIKTFLVIGWVNYIDIKHYKTALEDMIKGGVSLLLRMRLSCSIWTAEGQRITKNGIEIDDLQAMNEVNLHRGRYPHLTAIDCFVDGQFLTDAVADGLIVGTPTGSTAYSLSAGGPIIHPSVQSLIITPICPRSLSFRPVLLPSGVRIQLRIGEESRAPAEVTVDGREIFMLNKGEYLEVQMSPYPIPCVNRIDEGVDWVKDINDLLKWNQNFVNKQLLVHGFS